MLTSAKFIKFLYSGKAKEVFLFQKVFGKEKLHSCNQYLKHMNSTIVQIRHFTPIHLSLLPSTFPSHLRYFHTAVLRKDETVQIIYLPLKGGRSFCNYGKINISNSVCMLKANPVTSEIRISSLNCFPFNTCSGQKKDYGQQKGEFLLQKQK